MAGLQPSMLSRRVKCAWPGAQLDRQFSLLRINAACAGSTGMGSRRTDMPAQIRRNTTFNGPNEDGLLGTNSIISAEDAIALEGAAKGGSGGDASSSDSPDKIPVLRGYARPLPVSPSYFSRQPYFNDSFLRLQGLFRQYGHLPVAPPDQVKRVAWKSLRDYRHNTGEEIKAPQYNKCIAIVKHLHKIHPSLKPASVEEALAEFLRDINPYDNVPKPLTIDRFGRAVGVGRRKTSVARAWVIEGTGEIQINGRALNEAFGRVHDRESATWALRATERIDKYNVWALVEGGGTTGQAEALTLAVAKGLAAHEPALKTALRKAGCIKRDPRVVERKKHGHVKARKMPAWVKR